MLLNKTAKVNMTASGLKMAAKQALSTRKHENLN